LAKLADIIGPLNELKLVEKIKDSENVVISYIKFLKDHMKVHYEHFVRSAKRDPTSPTYTSFNLQDLLYYHVYGDYRMVYKEDKVQLKYITLDPATTGNKPSSLESRAVNSGILNRAPKDGIVGIYVPGPTNVAQPTYKVDTISWMDEEINKDSSGYRLMLPSIGTQIVTTFAFATGEANINTFFKKLVTNMMEKLNSFIYSRSDNIRMTENELSGGETDYVLTYLLTALSSDADFLELSTTADHMYSQDSVSATITTAFEEETVESAIKVFVDKYIQDAGAKFAVGETVYVKDITKIPLPQQDGMRASVGEDADLDYGEYTVIQLVAPETKGGAYRIHLRFGGTLMSIDGVPISFNQEQFRKAQDTSKATATKKKNQYYRQPAADQLVFYRILLDQLIGLQAYLYSAYGDELHYGYLSDGINLSSNVGRIAKDFPAFLHPITGNHTENKKLKKDKGFIPRLIEHRNLYTTIALTSQRSMVFDKTVFDQFYKGDMVKKEVEWLANALSDWGKVIVEQPTQENLLNIITLKPVGGPPLSYDGGNARGILQTGEADRGLSLYRVEIPMLKQVIHEYNQLYNSFTISNAFRVVEGDPNESALAKALWASLEKRTSALFELPGIKPHAFFDNIFVRVGEAVGGGAIITTDPYPPAWAGTSTLANLVQDPNQLETPLTIEDNKKHLKEYLAHLKSKYQDRWPVPSAILTAYDNFIVAYNADPVILRTSFSKRLESDNKKNALRGTDILFQAYSQVISIMRAQLEVPLGLREKFIAEGIDNELELMKAQLAEHSYDDKGGIAAYAESHPKYTDFKAKTDDKKEKRVEREAERALEVAEVAAKRVTRETTAATRAEEERRTEEAAEAAGLTVEEYSSLEAEEAEEAAEAAEEAKEEAKEAAKEEAEEAAKEEAEEAKKKLIEKIDDIISGEEPYALMAPSVEAPVEAPAFLHNPGLIVSWEPVGQVAVVGDIHGDKQTMELILAHLSDHHSEARVIFNGDKVDGRHFPYDGNYMEDFGPTNYVAVDDDLTVVNRITNLMNEHPDKYITTQGNHERPDLQGFSPAFMWEALAELGESGKEIREGLLEQFGASPIIIDMGEAIVAHGGLPEGLSEVTARDDSWWNAGSGADSKIHQTLWNRPDRGLVKPRLADTMKELNKTIFVCGHTSTIAAPERIAPWPHEAWFHNEDDIIMFSNQTTRAYSVSYTLLDFDKRTITIYIFSNFNKSENPWSDVIETEHTYPFPTEKPPESAAALKFFAAEESTPAYSDSNDYISMNQIEVNPRITDEDTLEACKEFGIPVVAFSPLGGNTGNWAGPRWMTEEVDQIKGYADAEGMPVGALLLGYAGFFADEVVTKTTNEGRIRRGPALPEISKATADAMKDTFNQTPVPSDLWSGTSYAAPGPNYYNADGTQKRRNPPRTMYFGTWPTQDSQPNEDNIRLALESGWTKLDTSDNYGTEATVATTIQKYASSNSGWQLESLITKVGGLQRVNRQARGPTFNLDNIEKLFAKLPIKDIHILIHWPAIGYVEHYKVLLKFVEKMNSKYTDKTFHAGVSNFGRVHLERLLTSLKRDPEPSEEALKALVVAEVEEMKQGQADQEKREKQSEMRLLEPANISAWVADHPDFANGDTIFTVAPGAENLFTPGNKRTDNWPFTPGSEALAYYIRRTIGDNEWKKKQDALDRLIESKWTPEQARAIYEAAVAAPPSDPTN
jgi:diketogulonate reductase-like aldo/keto reductase